MLLDRAWIERHIPHQGRMCLLDEVVSWDTDRIACRSGSHRAPDNPLRSHGRLGVACGIEYAAQAMAVHAALLAWDAAGQPRPGYLASVRAVRARAGSLDDVAGALLCQARRVAATDGTASYEFSIERETDADDRVLLSGRATVVLGGGAP